MGSFQMPEPRLLGVSYNTYKKYVRKYGIFEDLKNPDGTGIRKGYNLKRGKYSLDDILKGKYPDYPVWKLKQRLLHNGYMLEKCNKCGFEEKRITDNKVPLVLDFIDGDRKKSLIRKSENVMFQLFISDKWKLNRALEKNTNINETYNRKSM